MSRNRPVSKTTVGAANAVADVSFAALGASEQWSLLRARVDLATTTSAGVLQVIAVDDDGTSNPVVVWPASVRNGVATLDFAPEGGLRIPAGKRLIVRCTAAGAAEVATVSALAVRA